MRENREQKGRGFGRREDSGPRKDGFSPKKEGYGPRRDGFGPKKEGYGPKRDGFGPKKEGFDPKKEGRGPKREGPATRKEGFGPKKEGFSPRQEGFGAPREALDPRKGFRNRPDPVEELEDHDNEQDKLEGRNSVLEAIKSGRAINKIFVAGGEREGSIKQIVAMAREKGILVQEVDKAKLDSMSTTRAHQGVIAFVAIKDYVEVDDILAVAKEKGEPPFIIILDEIKDVYNLGSILRTADAVGAHGVIIPKRRAIGLTAAVSKASAGAVEYVPVARVTNLAQTIESLKKEGVWIVGTDSSGRDSFYNADLKGPMGVVIGSEGEGIGKLIADKCDFVVNIPMKGQISSLNAAVAGAIVMYEILKQRSK